MSDVSSGMFREAVWEGRPWILPSAVARTIGIIVLVVILVWVEFYFGVAGKVFLGVGLFVWTGLLLVLVWLFSMLGLLVLRASHRYVLRSDSLEIKTGILSLKRFVIVPSGFSDLEVSQSVLERMFDYGSVAIRSQSETDSNRRMLKIRSPSTVADQIRYVMARPIVRMDMPEGLGPAEPKM